MKSKYLTLRNREKIKHLLFGRNTGKQVLFLLFRTSCYGTVNVLYVTYSHFFRSRTCPNVTDLNRLIFYEFPQKKEKCRINGENAQITLKISKYKANIDYNW